MITLADTMKATAANKELIANFDRLRGTNLSLCGSPLELAIDKASGRLEHDLMLFLEFVIDIHARLPQ